MRGSNGVTASDETCAGTGRFVVRATACSGYSRRGRGCSVSAPMLPHPGANIDGRGLDSIRMMSLVWRGRASPSTSPHWPPLIEGLVPARCHAGTASPGGCRTGMPGYQEGERAAGADAARWVGRPVTAAARRGYGPLRRVRWCRVDRTRLRAAATGWHCGTRCCRCGSCRRLPPAAGIAFPSECCRPASGPGSSSAVGGGIATIAPAARAVRYSNFALTLATGSAHPPPCRPGHAGRGAMSY